MALVHELQHGLGGGFRAEAHVPQTAGSHDADFIFAHAADEVGRGLKGPGEFDAGVVDALCDGDGSVDIDGEVGVEESELVDAVFDS